MNRALLCGLLFSLACEKNAPANLAPDAAVLTVAAPAKHDEHEELPSRIHLNEDAQREAKIRVEPVQRTPLSPTVDLTGELVADPDQVARISARAAGRLVEVHFREGDSVTKGAVLAVVESPDLARARAAWTSSSARAEAGRQNAERLSAAVQQGLAPAHTAALADAESRALAAEALAAQQILSAFGVGTDAVAPEAASQLRLRAPISGVVMTRQAVVGETVTADHVLATVVNLQRAHFQARVFERNLAEVQPGKRADVKLNAYPDENWDGVVESVGFQVDPVARTVVARVGLKNRGNLLRLGLFGTARVVVGQPHGGAEVLTLPTSAVTRLGQQHVAFVAQPDGIFEVHPLTLGATAAGRVEVLSGIRADEQVVVDGVFPLRSMVLKSTFGEEE